MAERFTSPKITHPKKRAFLAAYRQTGNISASTTVAQIERKHFYWWCEHDAVFAEAAAQAKEEFGDLLEAKLSSLALRDGNVTALIVDLKMAGRFVEKTRSEVSGPNGQPIQLDTASAIDAAIERRLAKLAGSGEGTVPLALDSPSDAANP